MGSSVISRAVVILAVVLAAAGAGGCSHEEGLYAKSKQSWDTPRSDQVEDSMRNRLARTQHDH